MIFAIRVELLLFSFDFSSIGAGARAWSHIVDFGGFKVALKKLSGREQGWMAACVEEHSSQRLCSGLRPEVLRGHSCPRGAVDLVEGHPDSTVMQWTSAMQNPNCEKYGIDSI